MTRLHFKRLVAFLVCCLVIPNGVYATGFFWWFGSMYFSTPDLFAFHKVAGADVATFKVLKVKGKETSFGKDRFNVYYWYNQIAGADPTTFELLDEAFGKDSVSVYYLGERIPDADPKSFVPISNNYGKDSRQCYRELKSFRVKDISTFRFPTEIYSEHRHSFAENNEVFTRDSLDYYYFDGFKVFAMNTVYADKLQIVAYDQSNSATGIWATDGSAFFCRGRRVPTSDLNSFQILNSFFSRDSKTVFYIDLEVQGADLGSFEVDSGNAQVGRDRYNTYWRNLPKSKAN